MTGKKRGKKNKHIFETEIKALFFVAVVTTLILYTDVKDQGSIFPLLAAIAVTAGLSIAVKVIWRHWKEKKYLNSDISKIDAMSGREFEEYLAAHFKQHGYKVKLTPESGDYGADLILEGNGERIAVQAKRHIDKVGNGAVQEVLGALGYYKAKRGVVVSNSHFTANARTLAEANNVELWDRDKIIDVFTTIK